MPTAPGKIRKSTTWIGLKLFLASQYIYHEPTLFVDLDILTELRFLISLIRLLLRVNTQFVAVYEDAQFTCYVLYFRHVSAHVCIDCFYHDIVCDIL